MPTRHHSWDRAIAALRAALMTLTTCSSRGKDRARITVQQPLAVGDTAIIRTSGITRWSTAAAAALRATRCRIFS